MARRAKLVLVGEEMRHIFAILTRELSGWPEVRARSMFGMRAFYRGTLIFAMLPEKRAFERPGTIAYKLPAAIATKPDKESDNWKLFDLESEVDIAAALACLDKAYRQADASRRLLKS
jgi:hypothetical protein